jgi:hypothetical protein
MPVPPRLCLLLLLLAASGGVAAAGGIRRCEGPDGVTIYTDRECSTLGAIDRKLDLEPATQATPPGMPPREAPAPLLRADCARRADTLLFDLRRAVENANVNRIAGVYHWVGVGRGGAKRVMDRLQRLADRPPVSIEFVFPEASPVHDDPGAFPSGTPSEDPVGVRILQGELGTAPPLELRLVRHAGCWWVTF